MIHNEEDLNKLAFALFSLSAGRSHEKYKNRSISSRRSRDVSYLRVLHKADSSIIPRLCHSGWGSATCTSDHTGHRLARFFAA